MAGMVIYKPGWNRTVSTNKGTIDEDRKEIQ